MRKTIARSLTAAAILVAVRLTYPSAFWDVYHLARGIAGWIIGMFAAQWWDFGYFLFAAVLLSLPLVVYCAWDARRSVIAIGEQAGVQHWPASCRSIRFIRDDTGRVIRAFLIELMLPAFLLLGFALVVETTVSILGVRLNWARLTDAILGILRDAWDATPTEMHQRLLRAFDGFGTAPIPQAAEAAADAAQKAAGAARPAMEIAGSIVAGVASAGASLLLYLVRRRSGHLNASRLIANEMELIARQTFASIPVIIAGKEPLIAQPAGTRLIGASSEREFLLLDSGSGLASRLPSCLLPSAVAFFQEDLSINQIYNGLLSEGFSNANAERRERFLGFMDDYWRTHYQPAAFVALYRFNFYQRLRRFSI